MVSVWQPEIREAPVAYAPHTPIPIESEVEWREPLELLHVEIFKVGNEELITALEILSPVNKERSHKAHADYLTKREELLASRIHFIEIDFLRAGTRPPLAKPVPSAPYYVMLSRANRRPIVQVWPIQISDKLPVLPVPLARHDPDVALDLSECAASVYERGGYDTQIDYREPVPPPRLSEQEESFAQQLLTERRKGNRT